jgi:NAD(P)-dependent dehydrogenase (short-subunit alcohol dehydrogenase family)/acyl carrier protein
VGGIGLTLAAYLARTVQAKLVLTSRSALPLADPRHAQVAALRALGAEVLVLPADVTDPVAMADVVATTLSRFGALHGVIHAAGVAGGGLIQGQTAASVAAVLAPKVTGTQVVHAVTQELALDFLVLCSSLTVLTGGLGQMAYCAANAFLDAFAYQAATCSGRFVLSINWSAWQEVGMAINSELSASFKGAQEDILKRGISPEDGQESFSRLLSTTSHNMVVSPQDLSVVLNNSRALTTQSVLEKLEQISASTPAHPRPELATTYIAARNEIEQKIINIWQAVLGVEPVGIDDNFFELGGNSLIGIQLVAQLKQEFNVTIPTVSLYEGPTVSAIAKILRQDEDEDPAFSQRRERGEKRRDRQKRNLRG